MFSLVVHENLHIQRIFLTSIYGQNKNLNPVSQPFSRNQSHKPIVVFCVSKEPHSGH